jgi:hypothetical protein
MLNSNSILYNRQQVENNNNVPDEDLDHKRTSPIVPAGGVVIEDHDVVGDNIFTTNPASPLHKHSHIFSSANKTATPWNVLLYIMDGVHLEVNTLVTTVASINTHVASYARLPKVSAHIVP